MRKIQIGVIGPEEKNLKEQFCDKYLELAYALGKELAKRGAVLVTGGCTGIAEAASKGAVDAGGITVGTPGPERGSSPFSTQIEICTPINVGDYLFAGILSSDVIIVFPGDAGTVAELAIAFRYRKPLILLENIGEGILEKFFERVEGYPQYIVKTAQEASELAIKIAHEKLNKLQEEEG